MLVSNEFVFIAYWNSISIMKKLSTFIISFLLLKFSFILCCLTEPNCFWRIKNSEDNHGDMRTDCGFFLLKIKGPIDNFYNEILNLSTSLTFIFCLNCMN